MLFIALILFINKQPSAQKVPTINNNQNETLQLGQTIFNNNCAACHGVDGSGYANNALPAPGINGSEHAWHHSDEQLIALIREGGIRMPAVGANWQDDELESVLAYVKQWWTPQQQDFQPGDIGEYR